MGEKVIWLDIGRQYGWILEGNMAGYCTSVRLYFHELQVIMKIRPHSENTSLVPRLPHSGTRTLKLCRREEPGIFGHVKSAKGRKEVRRKNLIMHGRTCDSEQEKERR